MDWKTCIPCIDYNGKIYDIYEEPVPKPPIHLACRCKITPADAIKAGEATKQKRKGIDYLMKKYGELPASYITRNFAKQLGWNPKKGNLATVAPGKMVLGGIYYNKDGKLPSVPGRVWYEADINYSGGFRNDERVLFSNDGLMFVTYDHYYTFAEIV